MGRVFVLCLFTQVLGKTEILAGGKIFPKLRELGKAEVCGCHRHAGAFCVFLSISIFLCISLCTVFLHKHLHMSETS